jgi:hypothetical protein
LYLLRIEPTEAIPKVPRLPALERNIGRDRLGEVEVEVEVEV